MRRRWIGAMLSALLLSVSVLHAVFACGAGAHEPPPCHASEEGSRSDPTGAPICCLHPATSTAVAGVAPAHETVPATLEILALTPGGRLPAITLRSPFGFDPLGARPSSHPRSHRLQTLTL